MISSQRKFIITTYSAWTVLSALRSGSPVKSRKVIYPLIDTINFCEVLEGDEPITEDDYNAWHQRNIEAMCKREPLLCVGWSAKIINVYLKTACYVGDLGRPNIRNAIHPPIDGGLWQGIEKYPWKDRNAIISLTHRVKTIKAITSYQIYSSIISGCRLAASELTCPLIEIEQLWDTTTQLEL